MEAESEAKGMKWVADAEREATYPVELVELKKKRKRKMPSSVERVGSRSTQPKKYTKQKKRSFEFLFS